MANWVLHSEPERKLSNEDRARFKRMIEALREAAEPLSFDKLAAKTAIPPKPLRYLLDWAVSVNRLRNHEGLYEY
jgi:hypothetical protein